MTKEELKKIVDTNKSKWTKDIENKVKVKTKIQDENVLIGKGSEYEIILLWSYFTGPAFNVHTTIELLIQEQDDGSYDYQIVEGIKQNNFKKKIVDKSNVGVNDLKNIFSNLSLASKENNVNKIATYLYKQAHPFWNVADYVKALETAVQHVLPKSYVECLFSKNLGKSITLYVTLGAKGETKVTLHNDPMYHVISLDSVPYDNFPDDGNLPDKLSADCSMSGLMVTPAEGSLYAFDRVKTGWRNKTGTPDAILNYIVEYFKKVKNIVKENKDRLPKNLGDKY